jgi:hypothetical protein
MKIIGLIVCWLVMLAVILMWWAELRGEREK